LFLHRSYRPMFSAPGKVPGSAALLRAAETGRLHPAPARTQSRSSTPDSNQSDDASEGPHDGGERTILYEVFTQSDRY
jgi:hypothetical protein